MAASSIPDPPPQLKTIQSYMKIAQDIERIDPVVSYWARFYCVETALRVDRDSPECKAFLTALLVWLENFKKTQKENEAVSNMIVGQAHFENFAMTIFNKADTLDRAGTANKSTVRMFFMAAVLFEVMAVFGAPTEEITQRGKYAKFKAAYIQKCLKAGQTPKPGPIDSSDLDGNKTEGETYGNAATVASDKVLDIPEVPTDAPGDKPQPKPQDPFIMNPGTPPASFKPSLPPNLPASANYPVKDATTPSRIPSNSIHDSTSQSGKSESTINVMSYTATDGTKLKPEDIVQSQKYCKFANSALQYDDIPTAVDNLQKALMLLTTGQRQG